MVQNKGMATVAELWTNANSRGELFLTGTLAHLRILVVPIKQVKTGGPLYALVVSETAQTRTADVEGAVR